MKKYKLGEICKLSSSKRIFENEYVPTGIPFIRGQEISDKSILDENAKFECYISEERYNQIKEKYGVPQKGDILMTAVGTIGNLVVLTTDRKFYFKDGNVIRFSDFSNKVNPVYLGYFMQSTFFNKQIEYALIGAVQKALTMVMLNNIEILLPDLPEQQRIAKVLSDIDSKIALNKKINRELETMAKEIYDYWFVQFDFPNEDGKPYKSSGGKMQWNNVLKREIPAGWEVRKLGEIAEVRKGSLITESETVPGKIKVVAAGIDYSYFTNESNRKANVITVSGSGANAGYINFWREPIFASDCTTVQCENDIETILCYYGLIFYKSFLMSNATGSAQPHVYPKQVFDMPFVVIPNNLKKEIEKILLPINSKIGKLKSEIENLTQLRDDELLPLLMNGQVVVK